MSISSTYLRCLGFFFKKGKNMLSTFIKVKSIVISTNMPRPDAQLQLNNAKRGCKGATVSMDPSKIKVASSTAAYLTALLTQPLLCNKSSSLSLHTGFFIHPVQIGKAMPNLPTATLQFLCRHGMLSSSHTFNPFKPIKHKNRRVRGGA